MTGTEDSAFLSSSRRRIRIVVLLESARKAGLAPVPVPRLHALAYLSNVLAPVWNMDPSDGKLLKRRRGPFYPDLQGDLDHLVGTGVVTISDIRHSPDDDNGWRLEADYRLNRQFASPILAALQEFADERIAATSIEELCFAVSAFTNEEIDSAFSQDATYSDPMVDVGGVIDFGEWKSENFSANAAEYFRSVLPSDLAVTPGEKIYLYMNHLRARLQHV